jgi:hypothetical protein
MPTEKLFKFLTSEEFDSLIDKTDEFLKIDLKNEINKDIKVALFLERYFRERLSEPILQNYAKQILDFLSDEEIENLLNFIQQNLFELREKLWQEEQELNLEEKYSNLEKKYSKIEEAFEEKEKRYIELMKTLIQANTPTTKDQGKPKLQQDNKSLDLAPQKNINNTNIEHIEQKQNEYQPTTNLQKLEESDQTIPQTDQQTEKTQQKIINLKEKNFKTISFEPQEKHSQSANILELKEKTNESNNLPETTIIITKKKDTELPKKEDSALDLSKL